MVDSDLRQLQYSLLNEPDEKIRRMSANGLVDRISALDDALRDIQGMTHKLVTHLPASWQREGRALQARIAEALPARAYLR